MSGTRALFASIGASVSLVAAAALALLAVSAMFAFGGWSDPVAQSGPQTALILGGGDDPSATQQEPLVLPARARSRPTRSVARPSAPPQRSVRSRERPGIMRPATQRPPKASFSPSPLSAPEAPSVTPAPAAPKPSAGDGVRAVGDRLSGTVKGAGEALAQVTDPLLPPVSAATQKVFDAVAELLARSAAGVAGTVDALPAPR